MSSTIRLTAAQALMRYVGAQLTEEGEPFIAGVWAIFGHGNVAGLGEALHGVRDTLPTWRGHNEQTMAHAAIAYAKQLGRRRAMAVTSSIGPGATNLVTAAALAYVNRLPVLLLPGDVFANRGPDPVLQQIEDFTDGTVSANDCFRPVNRYFDRITRPEQLLLALPRAFRTMTDPADCGPVTLALCQDVQAEAYDWPERFFAPRVWHRRRPQPDPAELARVTEVLARAAAPVIVAGGGVHYSGATEALDPLIALPEKDSNRLPTDQQVIGAVQRAAGPDTVVMSAAGTMPGELHKLWKASRPMSYHMEYGYSCMGYEIAGALGVKMAEPERDVVCMIGDGSYMMANSELATAVTMGIKITLVVTDNRGFGCINRLQMATGGAEFNNLLEHAAHVNASSIDFAAHAASMGAASVHARTLVELEEALARAKEASGPFVVVIDTDPYPSTPHGGHWWDVVVPEVSERAEVDEARSAYETNVEERA